MRRWLVRLAVLLVLIGTLKLVSLDSKFYYPNQQRYDQPEQFGLAYEDVVFETRDGLRLHGWFLPAATNDARGVVVHFHGNAANVSAHVSLVEWLPRAGYHVLMFDYRGYGKSQGTPTRAGTILDGHAALDYAYGRPEARDLPVFAYGQSLGGAVAIVAVAERNDVDAVIAESTFSTYRKIAARHAQGLVYFDVLARPLAALAISAGHDPLDVVAEISPRPLLIIAAEHDTICFPELARELYEAAEAPKSWWLAPEADHLCILLSHYEELQAQIIALFESAATTTRPANPMSP